MADKWAEYLISAVSYSTAGTHIDKAQVREDAGDKVGPPGTWERLSVVSSLEAGCTFMTITLNSENQWQPGAMVRTVTVKGKKYIRTDADATEKDNLGALPGF